MQITYQSVLNFSLPAIAEIHTTCYGGGWVSTPVKLAEIFRVQGVDLEHSLVAYDGRRPVGIAFFGRRRAHGWLYDFAIAPAYRGQGLGTRLLMTTTREAAKAGIRDIELDVWEKRDDAIRLYKRAGFEHRRTYLNFEATGLHLRLSERDLAPTWRIQPWPVESVIPWYANNDHEPEPCWDRRLPSLLTYADAKACILEDERGPVACLHYAARPAAERDPDRIRPMFVGLRADAGTSHLRALFAAAAQINFGSPTTTVFRIALEPETSRLVHLLADLGMRLVGRALDMRLNLQP